MEHSERDKVVSKMGNDCIKLPSMEVNSKTLVFRKNVQIIGDFYVNVKYIVGTGEILADDGPQNMHFNVIEPTPSFTGREEFIHQLHTSIENSKDRRDTKNETVRSQIKIITGPAGIGKTEIIRQYILLYAHNYNNVLWIDAEDSTMAEAQFVQLAQQELKISLTKDKDNAKGPKTFDEILAEVYSKMCLLEKKLLIVFDNAARMDEDDDNDDEIQAGTGIGRFIPPSLPTECVRPVILITSRNEDWGAHQAKVQELKVWSDSECETFLLKQLRLEDTEENRRDAGELVRLLGSVPESLKIPTEFIRLQEKRRQVLGKGENALKECIQFYKKNCANNNNEYL